MQLIAGIKLAITAQVALLRPYALEFQHKIPHILRGYCTVIKYIHITFVPYLISKLILQSAAKSVIRNKDLLCLQARVFHNVDTRMVAIVENGRLGELISVGCTVVVASHSSGINTVAVATPYASKVPRCRRSGAATSQARSMGERPGLCREETTGQARANTHSKRNHIYPRI